MGIDFKPHPILPGLEQTFYRDHSIVRGMHHYGSDYDYEVLFDRGPARFMTLDIAKKAIDLELEKA